MIEITVRLTEASLDLIGVGGKKFFWLEVAGLEVKIGVEVGPDDLVEVQVWVPAVREGVE